MRPIARAAASISRRGEATSGNAANDVHFVEQPAMLSVHKDLRTAQLFQHTVREGRRPRSAPGERERETAKA